MPALLLSLAIITTCSGKPGAESASARLEDQALDMFYHAFDSYMKHAFPHDELKPLTKTYTDSLGELGDVDDLHQNTAYTGCALSLIDALSTLAVIGDRSSFQLSVNWLLQNLTFDLDVKANAFEMNIRLLGGLLSGHLLAEDAKLGLMPGGYEGGLLDLALDLGTRLLPAFTTSPTGLPFPWVNLYHGVHPNETVFETNTAAVGSFSIELGVLSRLTGQPIFERCARQALRALWRMRTPLGLFGTSLDMMQGIWLDNNGGIGASADSFYEYLLKAYILFGDEEYWVMFKEAYTAAVRHYKIGPWYINADIWGGAPTQRQFTSLQSFWPGMQVLAGDVSLAESTFAAFFSLWERFGLLPERFTLDAGPHGSIHPTEQYYPLRPELIESAFYLYQATGKQVYMDAAQAMVDSLNKHARAPGGFSSIRSVVTMEQEDHMPSYFLAETCKYAFLLANSTFWKSDNYIFTTEGHPIPIGHPTLQKPGWEMQSLLQDFDRSTAQGSKLYNHNQDTLDKEGFFEVTDQATDPESSSVACSSAPSEHERELGMHAAHSNSPLEPSAFDRRICPVSREGALQSCCYVPDLHADASCSTATDCGVDATLCRVRMCSPHGWCITPPQAWGLAASAWKVVCADAESQKAW